MELLTIIIRSLEFFTLSILLISIISFATIKIKSRKKEQRLQYFSNQKEGTITMADRISTKVNHEIEMNSSNTTITSDKIIARNRIQRNRNKIYAVYKPESNPNFYLHNHMNWYKNLD